MLLCLSFLLFLPFMCVNLGALKMPCDILRWPLRCLELLLAFLAGRREIGGQLCVPLLDLGSCWISAQT